MLHAIDHVDLIPYLGPWAIHLATLLDAGLASLWMLCATRLIILLSLIAERTRFVRDVRRAFETGTGTLHCAAGLVVGADALD